MVSVRFTRNEGKTSEGCPIAKWIIQRAGPHEKYLVVVKERYKHYCDYTWVVAAIISWNGLPRDLADKAYEEISSNIYEFGELASQKCKTNKKKVAPAKVRQEQVTPLDVLGLCSGMSANFADPNQEMLLENSS